MFIQLVSNLKYQNNIGPLILSQFILILKITE